jgi:hypothetical protein
LRPDKTGSDSWERGIAILDEENRLFREVIAALPPERLPEPSARKKWTLAQMIAGVAFHDVYHAGQIQLLKRLQERNP